jgi:myotubularin-related protein 14
MISGTGSLRSQDSNIIVINEYHHQASFNQNNNNNHNAMSSNASTSTQSNFNMCSSQQSAANVSGSGTASNGSSNFNENNPTIVDDDCFTANDYFMRRERLNSVRTLFYNCYSSTIGYKFKNGADSALGSLLGNFAEKVGLTQRTSV